MLLQHAYFCFMFLLNNELYYMYFLFIFNSFLFDLYSPQLACTRDSDPNTKIKLYNFLIKQIFGNRKELKFALSFFQKIICKSINECLAKCPIIELYHGFFKITLLQIMYSLIDE